MPLFSSMLGNYTTHGGSVSRGDRSDSHSVQLMGRSLMTVDEIVTLPRGRWILIKSGEHPLQVHLRSYDIEEKIRLRAQAAHKIVPGMFDTE